MFNNRDTCIVKGMLIRGDRQHDIASYFGVNGGRVAEVKTENDAFPSATPMEEDRLPPPGPYITKYAVQSVIETLQEAIDAIDMAAAEEDVEDVKAALMLAKETLQNRIVTLEEA